jgi:tryptophan synthase beta chain
VGPEHAHLAAIGRATYVPADDEEVLDALQLLARTEGIIPALESAHAVAWVAAAARRGELVPGTTVLITLSGRGDKDAETVMGILKK